MNNAQRLALLREYGMLQAQVFALQEKMRTIETQIVGKPIDTDRVPTAKKVREYFVKQKGEVASKDVARAIGGDDKDERARVWAALTYMTKHGEVKKLATGRYRSIAA